jgi:hypothetical protein
MKSTFFKLVIIILLFSSCNKDRIRILDDAALGMTFEEYKIQFGEYYTFKTEYGNINGKLSPIFNYNHLTRLEIKLDPEYSSNSYGALKELFIEKYGTPNKIIDTSSIGVQNWGKNDWTKNHSYHWTKGQLTIIYSYDIFNYSEKVGVDTTWFQATSGNIIYSSDYNFENQFFENHIDEIESETKSKL